LLTILAGLDGSTSQPTVERVLPDEDSGLTLYFHTPKQSSRSRTAGITFHDDGMATLTLTEHLAKDVEPRNEHECVHAPEAWSWISRIVDFLAPE